MRPYELIMKKRDGDSLSADEISLFIKGVTSGETTRAQASAFLMAVCLKGMNDVETLSLTKAMLASGAILDTRDIPGVKLDKHSTGGVGDKTSIILAPLLSAMGVKVPMISGRALGHTGGTLDKFESIPGMSTSFGADGMLSMLRSTGACIAGQSEEIAPADRVLYALRDETATVDSIPLIASSIMSKKLSEGLDGLVLDVKTGSGAFMKEIEDARTLAKTMVSIGNSMGVKTVAIITDMDQPLGRTVGNALELKECISALRGRWSEDLRDVTLMLASWMLNLNDALAEGAEPVNLGTFARRSYSLEALEFMEKGDAFKKLAELVDSQGGDPEIVFNPSSLPSAAHVKEIRAHASGYIRRLNAESVGMAATLLGAGRKAPDDDLDHSAGIVINKKAGQPVEEGEPVALMHTNDPGSLKEAEEAYREGLLIADREAAPRPLIHEVIM
jgi:pyrimidine-nucleoside phosphorylase